MGTARQNKKQQMGTGLVHITETAIYEMHAEVFRLGRECLSHTRVQHSKLPLCGSRIQV